MQGRSVIVAFRVPVFLLLLLQVLLVLLLFYLLLRLRKKDEACCRQKSTGTLTANLEFTYYPTRLTFTILLPFQAFCKNCSLSNVQQTHCMRRGDFVNRHKGTSIRNAPRSSATLHLQAVHREIKRQEGFNTQEEKHENSRQIMAWETQLHVKEHVQEMDEQLAKH